MKNPILIRTDASREIGTGHFMRCFALADAFIDNGEKAVFSFSSTIPDLVSRLDVRQIEHHTIGAVIGTDGDANATATLAKEIGAQWVLLDGYRFDGQYQAYLKAAGLKIMMIDDFSHAEKYYADLVLNQNASASPSLYETKLEGSRLLLGPKYAMIRREFIRLMGRRIESIKPLAERILITLGGSDPCNRTAQVVACLKDADDQSSEVLVIVGAANNDYALIEKNSRSRKNLHIVKNPPDIAEIMASVDLAIVSGGTSTYELCYLGVPFIVIIIADNQIANANSLQEKGITISFDGRQGILCGPLMESLKAIATSQNERARMRKAEIEMVDGYGAERALMHLRGARIWLRRAVIEDEKRTLEWSNEEITRANSFHPEKIAKEVHAVNFRKWLSSDQTMLLVAVDEEENLVGQVRFDFTEKEACISISLDKRFRGKGIGAEMIRYSCQMIMGSQKATRINAFVKKDNEASIKAFEKVGFVLIGRESRFGQECLHYITEKG